MNIFPYPSSELLKPDDHMSSTCLITCTIETSQYSEDFFQRRSCSAVSKSTVDLPRKASGRGAAQFGRLSSAATQQQARPPASPAILLFTMRLLQHQQALPLRGDPFAPHASTSVGSVGTRAMQHICTAASEKRSSPSCGRSLYHRETALLAVCLMMAAAGESGWPAQAGRRPQRLNFRRPTVLTGGAEL